MIEQLIKNLVTIELMITENLLLSKHADANMLSIFALLNLYKTLSFKLYDALMLYADVDNKQHVYKCYEIHKQNYIKFSEYISQFHAYNVPSYFVKLPIVSIPVD